MNIQRIRLAPKEVFFALTFLIATFQLMVSCKDKEVYTAPVFEKITVSDIKTSDATVISKINTGGSGVISEFGFVYDVNPNPTTSASKISLGSSVTAPEDLKATITGLKANTKYYLRAYLIDDHQAHYGTEAEFSTDNLSPPTVTTENVSNILSSSASVGVKRQSLGSKADAKVGVCWSAGNQNPSITDSKTEAGSNSAPEFFSLNLTGLSPNTTYYVRAYVTNDIGTGYGDVKNLKTTDVPPPTVGAIYWSEDQKYNSLITPTATPSYTNPCSLTASVASIQNIWLTFPYNKNQGGEDIVKVGVCARPSSQSGDPVSTENSIESTYISTLGSFFYNDLKYTGNSKTVTCGSCPTGGGVYLGPPCGNQTAKEYKYENPLIVPYTIYLVPSGTKKTMEYNYRAYVVTSSGKIYYGPVKTINPVF